MAADHGKQTLLSNYNRQCPDCRRAIAAISERRARKWLAEAAEVVGGSYSRVRLQNAIAIWQQAAKRNMTNGKSDGR